MPGRILKTAIFSLVAALLVSVTAIAAGEIGRYQTRAEFLMESFGTDEPSNAVIWFDGELRSAATSVMGHPPATLRMRYWYDDTKTAWIIDEIGKEQPITFGIVVENDKILALRVMNFRESRGWEIRYPFFTQQFSQIRLNESGSLNRRIDSISGATLSVNAATKSANLALILDEHTRRATSTAISSR
jgi:hypothetical protein